MALQIAGMSAAHLVCRTPAVSAFGFANDVDFTKHLIREIGVAVVPGSSFYHDASLGSQQVRFCFCKKDETLEAAAERLQKLSRG